MAITPTDETNLLLPLFEGIFERPLWETFLRRLGQRTGARKVRMILRNAAAPGQPPLRLMVMADRLARGADPEEPDPLDARVYPALRPNRAYSLEDIRDIDPDGPLPGDVRLIRVAGRDDLNAWIVLLHDRPVFGAEDSALLTALTPALATALTIYAAIGGLRMRAEAAKVTLALLGIEQEVLDSSGQVIGPEPRSSAFAPLPSPGLAEACALLAGAPAEARRLVRSDHTDLLLRPAARNSQGLPHSAAAVAVMRSDRREDEPAGAEILARLFGLSAREAALAEAISRGVPLVEAGQALQLTPETTRNYSKRIYAKTGTSGQADLVRLVLSGLAPLG